VTIGFGVVGPVTEGSGVEGPKGERLDVGLNGVNDPDSL
jgi:hypothetical protein